MEEADAQGGVYTGQKSELYFLGFLLDTMNGFNNLSQKKMVWTVA